MANPGVSSRHKDYDRFANQWKRVRDVCSGQDAIYAGGVAYLPLLADETPEEYSARQRRTSFYNASWRTIAAFLGMLFRKPPILEVPDRIKPLLDDVTLSGVTFDNFSQDVALEDLEVARVGILVDYPPVIPRADGRAYTVAEIEAMGIRPSMAMYKTENILNWKYGRVKNRTELVQVRLLEIVEQDKSEFETQTIRQIRVLDLFNGQYRQRVFNEESGEQIGDDIFPKLNGAPLGFIPFYIIGPDGNATEPTEPVLIDLIDLNLKHFQVSADYEHGCHFTGLPTPVIKGVQAQYTNPETGIPVFGEYKIGSMTAWVFPNAEADAKFLEFTGQGLTALEKNLERKEAQMAALGARMLTPDKAGVEAAETVAMRHSGENSILGAIAIAVSEGLERALKMFCRWAGASEAEIKSIKFQLNRDFMPYTISPEALKALLAAVQAGQLSNESFFDLLKRGDIVAADLSFEDEQARIDTAPPMPGPVDVNGNPSNRQPTLPPDNVGTE